MAVIGHGLAFSLEANQGQQDQLPDARRDSGRRTDALKTRRPRADNTCVLCQCSAPNHHATRRFAARYCTRRERQARHQQPKPGRQPLPGFRCFWRFTLRAQHSRLPVAGSTSHASPASCERRSKTVAHLPIENRSARRQMSPRIRPGVYAPGRPLFTGV